MIKILQDIIESAQKEYKYEFIWLREANLEFNDKEFCGEGIFVISKYSGYKTKPQ